MYKIHRYYYPGKTIWGVFFIQILSKCEKERSETFGLCRVACTLFEFIQKKIADDLFPSFSSIQQQSYRLLLNICVKHDDKAIKNF